MLTEDDPDMPANENNTQPLISAIGKLKVNGKELAKELHEARDIYVLYGLLDGLSLSYSMMKYAFDMLYTNSSTLSSDAMHNWMVTKEGFAAIAAESFLIISFSYYANKYDPDDKDAWKSYLATVWPYYRDSMKGLKNAYKGIRSTFMVAEALGVKNLNQMIVPVGLLLGVFSAFNRMWMRKMIAERKGMMKANSLLLLEIHNKDIPTESFTNYYVRMGRQSDLLRIKGMLGAAYGGIVDGMYLFMGVMTVCSFTPQVYLALSVSCIIFSALCIVTRCYEEYDFQRQLLATQDKIKLALLGKKIQETFKEAIAIAEQLTENPQDLETQRITTEYITLGERLHQEMLAFKEEKRILKSRLTLSMSSAFLAGLRGGLAAYSASASLMFAMATVYAMLLAPVSPTLVIAAVISGPVFLIVSVLHSLINNYFENKKLDKTDSNIQTLNRFIQDAKQNKLQVTAAIKLPEVEKAIKAAEKIDPPQQYPYQEFWEVIRSLFSGVAKGQKSIDYTFNPLQEPDEKGHYHDTPIMLKLTIVSSIIYAIGLALRALAKGFGKPPITKVESAPNSKTTNVREGENPSPTEDNRSEPPSPSCRISQPTRPPGSPVLKSASTSRLPLLLLEVSPSITLDDEPHTPKAKFRQSDNPYSFHATPPRREASASLPKVVTNFALLSADKDLPSIVEVDKTPSPRAGCDLESERLELTYPLNFLEAGRVSSGRDDVRRHSDVDRGQAPLPTVGIVLGSV